MVLKDVQMCLLPPLLMAGKGSFRVKIEPTGYMKNGNPNVSGIPKNQNAFPKKKKKIGERKIENRNEKIKKKREERKKGREKRTLPSIITLTHL